MYWADEMVPKRENGQAANRRLTRYIMLASLFHHKRHTVHVHAVPGRVTQSLTCLATFANLTADPGVTSSIPAWSHTFVEIDHEIISTVILLPSVFKLAQENVWLGKLIVTP